MPLFIRDDENTADAYTAISGNLTVGRVFKALDGKWFWSISCLAHAIAEG